MYWRKSSELVDRLNMGLRERKVGWLLPSASLASHSPPAPSSVCFAHLLPLAPPQRHSSHMLVSPALLPAPPPQSVCLILQLLLWRALPKPWPQLSALFRAAQQSSAPRGLGGHSTTDRACAKAPCPIPDAWDPATGQSRSPRSLRERCQPRV